MKMQVWVGATFLAAAMMCVAAADGDCAYAHIERQVAAADRETVALQARLKDHVSLAAFATRVRRSGDQEIWTDAFQQALDTHEIITVPARPEPYYLDGTLKVPSNRRIEANGATIRLVKGMGTLMLRNANTKDGTRAPIATGERDMNIAIIGGRWEDWRTARAGYGTSGNYDVGAHVPGNFYGVTTLFLFCNCNHVLLRDVTFHHVSSFSVQVGAGDAFHFENILFDTCFADGLHLNGDLTRVHAKNVRGAGGDDLVALNAYDWQNSSITFGPQRFILCEDLELVPHADGGGYPAIRLLPAVYRFADGSEVDCSISDVIFRRVKGVVTYKMYFQTPAYKIGTEPEWGRVGSGGNLFFEALNIDLKHPIDQFPAYMNGDPVRGDFGAFEFGANLSSVTFRDIDITFHADQFPRTHLATVGPKSIVSGTMEVFDPYVSCTVDVVRVENVRCHGVVPKELVHATSFDNVNGDGRSTGRGVVKDVSISLANDK